MIDISLDSIRIFAIVVLGVIWFALVFDTLKNGDES